MGKGKGGAVRVREGDIVDVVLLDPLSTVEIGADVIATWITYLMRLSSVYEQDSNHETYGLLSTNG